MIREEIVVRVRVEQSHELVAGADVGGRVGGRGRGDRGHLARHGSVCGRRRTLPSHVGNLTPRLKIYVPVFHRTRVSPLLDWILWRL